jgi:hypothetical protein
MLTETVLKSEGMKVLVERFGLVETERFIALMNRERFDYTEWQRNLWEGMSVREISDLAMKEYKNDSLKK